MKNLVENLFRHIVPINEGYDYLFADEVFIPVYETSLLVTKRTIMPINLVEEKILQLLDIGISQIDELAHILGVKRRLLEVTLADLYTKDLVMVSSNSCQIMTAGREALNSLKRVERKQDILKNICIDGILGKVIDASEIELIKVQENDDNKLREMIQLGDVNCYIRQFKEISLIFDEENKLFFSEGVQPIKEELLKIDKVESEFVKFIKIPIYVYVSSNGIDIDIVQRFNRQKELLDTYKDYIIEQINNRKVLKRHFKFRHLSEAGYEGERYAEKEGVVEELKKIHFNKNKKNIDFDLISNMILSNRQLLNGEYSDILKYIINKQQSVELYIDNLDDWAFDSSFISILTNNLGKAKVSIFYRNSYNLKKAKEQIDQHFKGVENYVQDNHNYYICWKLSEYMLYGIPRLKNVINENTTCTSVTYYLQKLIIEK